METTALEAGSSRFLVWGEPSARLAGRWVTLCPQQAPGSFSYYKDTSPMLGGSTPMTSSKPVYLPNAPPPKDNPVGVRVSTYEFCGDRNVQLITMGRLDLYLKSSFSSLTEIDQRDF